MPVSSVAGSIGPPATQIDRISMRFCVSVPVLSVQMTDAEPSVSTLGRWRTSVPLAMRRAAMAIATVTVGNSPSGTFATMMPIAKTMLTDVERPMN